MWSVATIIVLFSDDFMCTMGSSSYRVPATSTDDVSRVGIVMPELKWVTTVDGSSM